MTPDVALQKRVQLITNGYCLIEDILTDDFLDELRRESDRMLDAVEHPAHWKYQGSYAPRKGKRRVCHQSIDSLAASTRCARSHAISRFQLAWQLHYPE